MPFSQEGGFIFLTDTGSPDIYVSDLCWPSTRMPLYLLISSLFILPKPLKFDHLLSSFRIWVNIIHASDAALSNRPPHCLAHVSHLGNVRFESQRGKFFPCNIIFPYFQMLVVVETKAIHDHLLQRDILPRIGLISEKFAGNLFDTFTDWPNTAVLKRLGGGIFVSRGGREGGGKVVLHGGGSEVNGSIPEQPFSTRVGPPFRGPTQSFWSYSYNKTNHMH